MISHRRRTVGTNLRRELDRRRGWLACCDRSLLLRLLFGHVLLDDPGLGRSLFSSLDKVGAPKKTNPEAQAQAQNAS